MTTAIYLRQSLDRNETELAISRQRDDCLALCARKDWNDVAEYVDNDISASSGKPRPQYARMCADIEAGIIGAVVVWRLDRLHRQPRELEQFIDLAEKHRAALATVTGDVDLSTENGRLIARITGAVDRAEMEKKSARQKAANRQRAKAGKAWIARSFGYDGDEIVAVEAEAIRRGCTALLDGGSLWGIATEWNTAGLKTAKGNTWTGGTVRQVLTRARNAGLQTYDAEVVEAVETSWPAIVERETWEAVRAKLADPSRHTGKTPGRTHLLSGIALCGVCGKTVGSAIRGGNKRRVYQCKRLGCMKIARDLGKTDEVVIDTITRTLANPEWAVTLAEPTADVAPLKARKKDLIALIVTTHQEYNDGDINAKDRNARIAGFDEKIAVLDDKLIPAHVPTDVRAMAGQADARQRFAALTLDRQRGVIGWMAVVTIHTQRAGGRFDPTAITVVGRKPTDEGDPGLKPNGRR